MFAYYTDRSDSLTAESQHNTIQFLTIAIIVYRLKWLCISVRVIIWCTLGRGFRGIQTFWQLSSVGSCKRVKLVNTFIGKPAKIL